MIVFNGSPLFTGSVGSGESGIRRWIIDNDWLEGIVALPDQLFYNTGISTYLWVVTNRKVHRRKGKIQLVDEERLNRVGAAKAFLNLTASRKRKDVEAATAEHEAGKRRQQTILTALSERDERAALCRDRRGRREPDPELRDLRECAAFRRCRGVYGAGGAAPCAGCLAGSR